MLQFLPLVGVVACFSVILDSGEARALSRAPLATLVVSVNTEVLFVSISEGFSPTHPGRFKFLGRVTHVSFSSTFHLLHLLVSISSTFHLLRHYPIVWCNEEWLFELEMGGQGSRVGHGHVQVLHEPLDAVVTHLGWFVCRCIGRAIRVQPW